MTTFDESGIGAIEALLRRSRRRNRSAQLFRPWSWWRDARALNDWSERLQHACCAEKPGVVHIAWNAPGMSKASQDESFELVHCLPFVAALAHHPDAQIMLHASAPPSGPYWRWLQPKITFVPWPRIELFYGASWQESDAGATLVRLLALDCVGGISPTNDGLLLRNCDDLRERRFVLSTRVMTACEPGGLTTDLIAAPPKHTFTRALLRALAVSTPAGTRHNATFILNAALYACYARMPEQVRVLPSSQCGMLAQPVAGKFLFDRVPDRFGRIVDETARLLPLWRSNLGDRWQGLLARDLEHDSGLFATYARRAIACLPSKDRQSIQILLNSAVR